MEMILLSWNVRGLNNSLAKRIVREFIGKYNFNILCIQETKVERWDDRVKNMTWDANIHGWACQNSRGLSGGLVTTWDKSHFRCLGFAQDKNWIWVLLESVQGKNRLNVVNVYAHKSSRIRRNCG